MVEVTHKILSLKISSKIKISLVETVSYVSLADPNSIPRGNPDPVHVVRFSVPLPCANMSSVHSHNRYVYTRAYVSMHSFADVCTSNPRPPADCLQLNFP